MRRLITVWCVLGLTAVLAACGGGGSTAPGSPGMMALRMPTAGPTTGTLPQYVASEMGFFREEGLEPTFVTVSSGAAMLPAVISGQVDASPSGLVSDVKAIQAGQDIRMVSGWTVGRNYFVLVRKGVDLPVNGTFEEDAGARRPCAGRAGWPRTASWCPRFER